MKQIFIVKQAGLSMIELVIVITLAGILMATMQGLIGSALNTENSIRVRNDSLQQGRFAMQLMVQSVRMTRRLMIPLAENPTTAYSESDRDVLAVTMDPTLDRDKDGWADANNDKDYLDINNNASRDTGEPERIDEDLGGDNSNDSVAGIKDIDDDGDGSVDEGGNQNDNDEDGVTAEDSVDGVDTDADGSIDEDITADNNKDLSPGIINVDDDYDGSIDEGLDNDDDEDGSSNEDWLDPVVYYLNGTTLIQRIPNINPANGSDYQENPVAENVSGFKAVRIPQGGGSAVSVEITLEITAGDGEPVSFNTQIRVGSGL